MTAPENTGFELVGGAAGFAKGWSKRGKATAEVPAGYTLVAQIIPDPTDFGAAWLPVNVTVTSDAVTGPAGLPADRAAETAVNNTHGLQYQAASIEFADAQSYIVRVALKNYGCRYAGLRVMTVPETIVIFDLDSDGLVVSSSGPQDAIAELNAASMALGDGWVLCSLYFTMGADLTTVVDIPISSDGTTLSYLGNITHRLALWGFEIIQGDEESVERFERGWLGGDAIFALDGHATAAEYDTVFVAAKLHEDFEEKWSSNEAFLTSLAATSAAQYEDSLAVPHNVESFDSGWSNDPYLTTFTGGDIAAMPSGTETFESDWSSNQDYQTSFDAPGSLEPADFDALEVEDFETDWTLTMTTV